MPGKVRLLILLVLFGFLNLNSFAQDLRNFSIKFMGLSVHPAEEPSTEILVRKIDNTGRYVMNLGFLASGEWFFKEDKASFRLLGGAMSECSGLFAGVAHVGLKFKLFSAGPHYLSWGVGPTLYFRENWIKVRPNHFDENYLTLGPWEYILLWYGMDFEYNININKNLDFSTTIIPAYPKVIATAFGLKYWIK
jgi:hypothetical protein